MNVENFVFSVVSDTLKIPQTSLKKEQKLSDLTRDSIQFFELLINFENSLKTSIEYEQVANVKTIEDIINLILSTPELRTSPKLKTKNAPRFTIDTNPLAA